LKVIDSLETGDVWVLKDWPEEAFFTIGKTATDWDGDPMAYGDKRKHKEIKPHDYLANAGHPGNWWGVVTNTRKKNGTPIEQSGVGPEQPYKNYMISTTKLVDTRYAENDVRRWTDATRIPYVALPNSRRSMVKIGLKPGCYCLLVNLETMKYCFGVYADSKAAKPRMGEISKRAAELLGNQSGKIFILVFPATGKGQGIIPSEADLQTSGRAALKNFSMLDGDDQLVKALARIANLSARIIEAGYFSTTSFNFIDVYGDDMQVTGTFGRGS
jgi:hypothetical protein